VPGGGAIPTSVGVAAGTHRVAPQASPAGQQAVTVAPKTQVGCAAAQASAQSPTPADEMQAAPEGQQPLPSAQAVCDAAQIGDGAALRGTRPPTTGRPAAAAGAGVTMAWRPAWSWECAVERREACAKMNGKVDRIAASLRSSQCMVEGYGFCGGMRMFSFVMVRRMGKNSLCDERKILSLGGV
jgi:hypothetical protein